MLHQSYLPKKFCWDGKSVQVASEIYSAVEQFLISHPKLRAYSGFRPDPAGDHRCGLAVDMVPLDFNDVVSIRQAYADAASLLKSGKVVYVEPLSATVIPGNHHLHISWKRCP